MKKLLLPLILLLLSCRLLSKNDFPPPPTPGTPFPMTVIVELPISTPTATLEPRVRPMLPGDMEAAQTFFLIFKTSLIAGNDTGVTAMIKYPIHVTINAQTVVLKNQAEFLKQYDKIFDPSFATALYALEESNLTALPDGVRVGNGELWFNYFCIDPTCSDMQFLITQVNK